MKKNRTTKRGIALVISLLLTTVVLAAAIAMTSLGIQQSSMAYNLTSSTASVEAALAGLNEAAAMFIKNSGWKGTELENRALLHAPGHYTVTFNTSQPYYSTNNKDGTTPSGYGGVTVPAGFAYIISTGTVRGQVHRVAAMISLPTSGGFSNAIAAVGQIDIGNGMVNAVNSAQTMIGNPPMYPLLNTGGNVATASSENGAVDMGSNGQIFGNVYYPGGATPSVFDGGSITGSVLPSPQPLSFLPVADPYSSSDPVLRIPGKTSEASPLPPGKYGTLSLSGSSQIWLTNGKYSFDHITLTGTAQINITGVPDADDQVFVYLRNGDNKIAGNGFSNTTWKPSKLQIVGGPECDSIKITGNGNLFGIIYAPQANVEIGGNGAIIGAVTASEMELNGNNAAIYYDQALGTLGGGSGPKISGFHHR